MSRTCKIKGSHCLGDTSNQWRKISADDWACNACFVDMRRAARKKADEPVPVILPTPDLKTEEDSGAATKEVADTSATVVKKKRGRRPKEEKLPSVSAVAAAVKDFISVDSLDGDRLCPKCGVVKPKTKFGLRTMTRQKGKVRVLQSQCSSCRATKNTKV